MKNLFKTCLFLGVLFIYACSKDDVEPSKTELLTGGNNQITWEIDKVLLNDTGNVTETFFDQCQLDDLFRFKNNGVVQVDPGVELCDSSDQIQEDQWKFHNNETAFIVFGDGYNDTLDIFQLTSTVFSFGFIEDSTKLEIVFSKK